MGVTQAVANAMTDLRTPGLGEGLTRRPAGHHIDVTVLDELRHSLNDAGVAQVPVNAQPGEVVTMGFHRLSVVIDGKDHVDSGLMKTETQSSGSREQVHSQQTVGALGPPPGNSPP